MVTALLCLSSSAVSQELQDAAGSNGDEGSITIESDIQSSDNTTGVVTAIGDVLILYPDRGLVATSRQAQYFTKEGRVVLSGDVDVIRDDGEVLKAEKVVYLLEDDWLLANPKPGEQVVTEISFKAPQSEFFQNANTSAKTPLVQ